MDLSIEGEGEEYSYDDVIEMVLIVAAFFTDLGGGNEVIIVAVCVVGAEVVNDPVNLLIDE